MLRKGNRFLCDRKILILFAVNCLLRGLDGAWHSPKTRYVSENNRKAFYEEFTHTSNKRCLISIPLFSHTVPCKGPSWSRSYGSLIVQLPVQSVPITTTVESLNTVHGEVYPIQQYVIKFASYLQQVGVFLRVIRFPSPMQLTVTI